MSKNLPAWSQGSKISGRRTSRVLLCLFVSLLFCSIIYSSYKQLSVNEEPVKASTQNDQHYTFGQQISQISNTHSSSIQPNERVLLKVGGVPSEGFGATLAYIRPAINMATALGVNFEAVRTFDFRKEYNVMDELNMGTDFSRYNWNKMCDLQINSMTAPEAFSDSWDERVSKIRTHTERFSIEAQKKADGQPYDKDFIEKVKERLAKCDVIIYADQELHQARIKWTSDTRKWISDRLEYNADIKIRQRKARAVAPADVHVHFRWGDMAKFIKPHTNPKWNFNETQAEKSIRSVESCLQRELKTNVFMKRSIEQESDQDLYKIISPLRQKARFIEGTDDLVDLVNLSRSKILVLTGGTYSVTAAAIGNPDLIIHNTFAPDQFDFIKKDGGILLLQGREITEEQCSMLKNKRKAR